MGIGNFDGCHLGHQKILETVVRVGGREGAAGVITFRNHTRLSGRQGGSRLLTTIDQRLEYFRRIGISACWLVDFNSSLSHLAPREFIDRILVGRLGIRGICVGEGFRFGAGRSGTVDLLRRRGREEGFPVMEVPSVTVGGREVRSSLIRDEIEAGRISEATRLLGRPYCLTGRVVRGRGRGRKLGYPTANFFPDQLLPASGVYAARISAGFPPRGGLLYVGRSPTFPSPSPNPVVAEAHIFDWTAGLGGRRIKVYLIKRLRGDITFKNEQELVLRMKDDERRARSRLKLSE